MFSYDNATNFSKNLLNLESVKIKLTWNFNLGFSTGQYMTYINQFTLVGPRGSH